MFFFVILGDEEMIDQQEVVLGDEVDADQSDIYGKCSVRKSLLISPTYTVSALRKALPTSY